MSSKLKVLVAFITYIVIFGVIQIIYLPQGQIIKDWKVIKVDENQVEIDIDAFDEIVVPYSRNIEEPGIYEFSAIIVPDNMNSNVLHLRRLNGYAFEVNLNGQMIYQQGDLEIPTANIWNHSFLIDIPDGLLHQKNILVISVHGLHDIGFIMEPTIGTRNEHNLVVELQNMVTEGLSYMIIGSSIILGILMILLGSKQKMRDNYYTQFGLSFITFSMYNLEYLYREYTGSLEFYLLFRKILYLMMMYAVGFLITGVLNFLYEYKINIKIKIFYYAALSPILLMPDFNSVRITIIVFNMILIVLSMFLVFAVLLNPKAKLRFSISFLMITIIHAVIVFLFNLPYIVFINYGITVILIGLTYTLVLEFGQLHTVNIQLENKTLIDGLTDAYNREYMDKIQASDGDLLIFMDIDYFKVYNDTLGHQKGDELLKEFVTFIKNNIRDEDSVIRYGGDEFVVYLQQTPIEQGNIKAETFKKHIQENYEYVDLSYGISSYKGNMFATIQATDKFMYRMKEGKKR